MSIGPFLGKWLQEEKQPDNIDEYLKATGIPPELQESIRTLRGTFDCRQEGDLWIIEAGFENKPELKKVYKFTPGVPFEDIDIFGRKFKMIANLEGDKLRDQITDWANSVVENIREVKDGVMYCTTTCNGVTTELKFHRP